MIHEQDIAKWGKDRGITTNSTPQAQFKKLLEEVGEIQEGIVNDQVEWIADGIGDTIVVLVMIAQFYGLKIDDCVGLAYRTIKDRKGRLNDEGLWVKDENAERSGVPSAGSICSEVKDE